MDTIEGRIIIYKLLKNERAELESKLNKAQIKIVNLDFANRAPLAVIKEYKKRIVEWRERIQEINELIDDPLLFG